MTPLEVFNPFDYLGTAAGKVVADAWTSAMLGVWTAGLWALQLVLRIVDALLTPDLSENGPAGPVYATTFWLAGGLVIIMLLLQIGLAVIRRDGKTLAAAAIGVGKFLIVWAGWVGYGVAVVAACSGLTRAIMRTVLSVDSWSTWQPWAPFDVDDITDGTVATVLGLLGLLLWLAAIGHLLVMITRAGALIVLAAMTPATAAGLVGQAGRSWFWKSLRWFHAAAFTPVLMVLMLGVGVQITTGVANGLSNQTEQAVGTALPGVILILISCFAPLALFKLLAFVDPATNSGAAFRNGLDAVGGLRGLLTGGPTGAEDTTNAGAGSTRTPDGRSAGEAASDDTTQARFTAAQNGLLRRFGGAVGGAAATALDVAQEIAARGTAIGSDLTNQMGVGHPSYHPYLTATGRTRPSPVDWDDDQDPSSEPEPPVRPVGSDQQHGHIPAAEPDVHPDRSPHRPADRGGAEPPVPRAGGGAGSAGASSATGSAVEAAATVPIVPV